MREIKFRAWDRKNKIMIPFTDNYICEEYSLLAWSAPEESEYHGIDALPDWNHRDERQPASAYYDIMQFTGLHDKNGKEIYEGDVVSGQIVYDFLLNGGPDIGIVRFGVFLGDSSGDEYERVPCVGWYYEIVKSAADFDDYNGNFPGVNVEVIGNIYESDIETIAKGK